MSNKHINDHEYFLGRLVASFQSLELTLIEYFAALLSWQDRELGYIVSDGLPFKKLVTTIDAVAKYKEKPEAYTGLSDLLGRCLKLEERRNKYVHGYWDITPTEGDSLKWVWFKRKNRLGKGNVHTEEKLAADLDLFVNQSTDLQEAIRLRIRKP